MHQVTKDEIRRGLKKLGLEEGDSVIVHSALSSLGQVKGGADTVIDVIIEVIGKRGNLAVPTFGSDDAIFDPATSKTNLGILPAALMKRKGVVRSRHPLASVAVLGPDAQRLIENHEEASMAHGRNTPYTRLSDRNGKIVLLGVDQDRNTFLHTIEEMAELSYLRTRKAQYVDVKGQVKTVVSKYFPGPHRNFISLQAWLEERGLTRKTKIGDCVAQLMPMKPLFDELSARLKCRQDLFISANPSLPDAVWQRAEIFRTLLKRETFTLCADSQFAGQYFEEIEGNCRRYGIENIVLSAVNNTPWINIPKTRRKWYLKGLKEAGIKVAAIRFAYFDSETDIETLEEAKVSTVILPSTTKKQDIVSRLTHWTVCLENVLTTGKQLISKFNDMDKKKVNVKLAFNPLRFAEVGENPFLSVYLKTHLRRHIGAMFINDGLANGERALLENGLSEIKELISILRCRSFSGLFILQGSHHTEFGKETVKFLSMLKETGDAPADH